MFWVFSALWGDFSAFGFSVVFKHVLYRSNLG